MKTGTKGARRRGNKLHNNCNCYYCTGTTKEELLKLKYQSIENYVEESRAPMLLYDPLKAIDIPT